jgi:hypothetical protein
MGRYLLPAITAIGLVISLAVQAQTPAVTATCDDGSPFSGVTRSGACRGHGGVKIWNTGTPSTTAPATGPTPTPGALSTPAPAPTTTQGALGAGQMWVTQPPRSITARETVGMERRKVANICPKLRPRAAASIRITTRRVLLNGS